MRKKPASLRIFIGHDSRHASATKVCRQSILNHFPGASITFLDKAKLKEIGVYGREDVEGESTEFSFTRFYVPLLMNYNGYGMFCDNDFLWRVDPREISMYLNGKPMAVVKHKDYEAGQKKMDGVVNKSYPKKNWSSLMLFDCAKLKSKLTKEYLDNATPSQLHEFKFLNEKSIAEIPKRYNMLVGIDKCTDNVRDTRALHYTTGGPWFDEYKNCEFSEEWWKIYETL